MIFPLAGLIFGAILGVLRARAKGGNRLDQLQWATVFGLVFGLVGLFVLIMIERSYV